MKKLLIFFLPVFMLFPFTSAITNKTSAAEKYYYAKVNDENIYLFSKPSKDSPLFEIPKSYFVIIHSQISNYYYVSYDDIYGYLEKDKVIPMDGTPTQPFAKVYFRVFALEGLAMQNKPSFSEGKQVALVPFETEGIKYYGKTNGQNVISEKSSIWYYSKYTTTSSTTVGYLYSVFCDKISQIPLNEETFPHITGQLFPNDTLQNTGISDTAKTLIIVGLSLPAALLMYLLIRPTITNKNEKKVKVKATKHKRRKDYFEFDENDLG